MQILLKSTFFPNLCIYLILLYYSILPQTAYPPFHLNTIQKEANELSPLLISSTHSCLFKPKDTKSSSTSVPHAFLCLPLRGLVSHSRLLLGIYPQAFYHHFNLALSLQLLNDSNPISPLTASLKVLYEQPRILLAPPRTMDSNAAT